MGMTGIWSREGDQLIIMATVSVDNSANLTLMPAGYLFDQFDRPVFLKGLVID